MSCHLMVNSNRGKEKGAEAASVTCERDYCVICIVLFIVVHLTCLGIRVLEALAVPPSQNLPCTANPW